MANLIGQRIERKEDKKFLTGRGQYTADINLAKQTYAYFVRSPHARASMVSKGKFLFVKDGTKVQIRRWLKIKIKKILFIFLLKIFILIIYNN